MGNLQSISDLTRLVQDVQYTSALKGMNPQERQNYFTTQKNEMINGVLDERESTFKKVYTDAVRNNSIQHSLLFYHMRNRDLDDLGKAFVSSNKGAIDVATNNKNLANRQNEINEWAYGNKLDTLFVFQILFITILLSAGLVYLQKLGFYSPALLGVLTGILLFIDIVILINRVNWTTRVRDQRYWNRRQFAHYDISTPNAPACPATSGFEDYSPAPVSAPGLIKV
jgi:hypothetical protein